MLDVRMKIVAGLGSVDEYIRFCKAGADEFFAGYVPYEWNKKYGTVLPLNRREVFCSNVQLGSLSELEILAGMIRKYDKPGASDLQCIVLYSGAVPGNRRYHPQMHEPGIYQLYSGRSGIDGVSE